MLDVRRLRVLREVAERGSFSAAADALSFTQSAVSQQIATLEREAGTRLLQRGAGGIRLTDAGRALVSHADVILARLADAERELAAIAGLQGGRVRLASFPSAGATLVTEAVSVFKRRHPAVELSLAEGEPDETIPLLKRGEFDLAVVFDYRFGLGRVDLRDGLERIHLLDDPLKVVLPPSHRLFDREKIPLAELAEEPWVAGCCGGLCHEMLKQACNAAEFEPNVAFESDDHNVLLGLVAAGVGVSLLPDLALKVPHPGVGIRAVAGSDLIREIFAAVPAESYRSPATNAMIAILEEIASGFRRDERKAQVAAGS
jgi:DNA-binding transcriptional LysR family regulator